MCWRGRTKSFDRRASRGEGVRKMAFNPKSKIQNPKWLGLFSIVLTFVIGGATATAQQPTKIPRIGFLSGRQSPDDDRRGTGPDSRHDAFRLGLRELGYVEGKNIVIEWRIWEG